MASKFRARVLPAAAVLALAASTISFAGVAAAASSCPTVNQNGAVNPPPAPGVDWSGCNLDNANLANADLATANLAGADLQDADLQNANVSGADLSKAGMTGAKLDGLLSGQVQGTPTGLPAPWVLTHGYFLGPRANLSAAQLSGLDLTDADLHGADFFDAKLQGANLSHVDLEGANMVQAILFGADLFGANVQHVDWYGARCPGRVAVTSCIRAFDFAGFTSPRPGRAVRRSEGSLTAVFKLYASHSGKLLTNAIGTAIARAHNVRVTLTGKGISPVAGFCVWGTNQGVFRCRVAIPAHVRTGRSHPYFLTAQENPGGQYALAPPDGPKIANPARIYFR